MIIKKYRCKSCGSQDFFLAEQAMHTCLYCNECGRFIKWADKDDKHLFLKLHLNQEYGKLATNWKENNI